jgi:serralysin
MLFSGLVLQPDDAMRALEHERLVVPVIGCNCPFCMGAANSLPQFGAAPGEAAASAQSAQLAPAGSAAQALLAGSEWSGATLAGRTVITYSFANAGSVYGADAGFAATLTPFSAADAALARAVLANIAAVCNVTFVEVADSGGQHGQIRYAYSQVPNDMGYAGFAYFPGTPGAGGDVWIGAGQATAQWDWYRADLVLHETLHAIGLKHPFDGAVTLDPQRDLITNTVMSYSPMAGSRSGALTSYPTEPMALDIAALQALYGAASRNDGDTVYDLSSGFYQSGFHAIWDSGGQDTFDASRIAHAVTLDLREGGHSDIGVAVGANAYYGAGASRTVSTTTYTQTITLAAGTTVENAVGSAGNDVIITSGATRHVDGGAGLDTVVFSGGVDDYAIASVAGGYALTSLPTHSVTSLTGVERIEFSDSTLQPASLVDHSQASDYEQAFRLYRAALDRDPDQGGLIFQARALESGLSLQQLAGNFIASPEFQQRYDVANNTGFVTLLYANVLDREPDAPGLGYYLNLLDGGATTRANVLVGFSESPENQANVQAVLTGIGMEGMLVPV